MSGDEAFARQAVEAEKITEFNRVMRQAAELVFPSVVYIETIVERQRVPAVMVPTMVSPNISAQNQPRIMMQRIEEIGSGVIVSINNKIWVITNRHVVARALPDSISITTYDNYQLKVKRLLLNADYDLALLEIELPRQVELLPIRIGDSDTVQLADSVLVIGRPYGLNRSISQGVISATARRDLPKSTEPPPIVDMLQTDAAINPGNSGGPLVNVRGEVIGIVSAIASVSGANEGVGFVIPMKDVMHVVEQLATNGEVLRPYLGVELAPELIDADRKKIAFTSRLIGAKISSVTPNSPASYAKLQSGDLITHYNRIEVENDKHLIRLIARSNIGDKPVLTVVREKETLELTPTLGAQKSK